MSQLDIPIEIPIVFQNDFVLVVDKPPECLSVPARFKDDPRPVLGRLLEQQTQLRLWPVHRLDCEVSGLIMYAKSADAHRLLNMAFEKHEVRKTYLAETEPIPQHSQTEYEGRVEWKSRVLRGKKRTYESPHGEMAVTFAEVKELTAERTQWFLYPQTGKPHQLRFELAKRKLPIRGDFLYGSLFEWPKGIALRAVKLELPEALAAELQMPSTFSLALTF